MQLRDYQEEGVAFLLPLRRAFLVAPAGSGKTIMAATAVARVARAGQRVGWLANTKEQCEQAVKAIQGCPGPEGVDFTVACAAGLPDFSNCDIIVVDEAHHSMAPSWLESIAKSGAIICGFSATPWMPDEERNDRLREFFCVFHTIERERVLAGGHIVEGKVWVHDIDEPGVFNAEVEAQVAREAAAQAQRFPVLFGNPAYLQASQIVSRATTVYAAFEARAMRARVVLEEHAKRIRWRLTQETLQANGNRNSKIVSLATSAMEAGESVLLLVGSIEHGELLAARIPGAVMCHSKMGAKKRREAIERTRMGENKVLVATSLADEGLDVPIFSCLVLAAGGRSAAKLEQRAGRVLRPHESKRNGGVIHDFLDRGIKMGHVQAMARTRTFVKLGYEPEIVK